MTLLPVSRCAQMLGVHPKTLHQWLHAAQLPVTTHPSDARIKCLSEQHLIQVATLHGRSLVPQTAPAASPEEQAIRARQVGATGEGACSTGILTSGTQGDVAQKLCSLERTVTSLQEHLAQLALAVLHEREQTFERRLLALETTTTHLLERPSSLSEVHSGVPVPEPRGTVPEPRTLHPAEVRARARLIPLVEYGASGTYVIICPREGELALTPDTPQWFEWLATLSSFRFVGQTGRFTASRLSKSGRGPSRSWRADRWMHNHTYKRHLGVTEHLTLTHLEQAAAYLQSYMTTL